MRKRDFKSSIFHLSEPRSCPYFAGRNERLIFTFPGNLEVGTDYGHLLRAGFRRSHAFYYRPQCDDCSSCIPIRVRVSDFRPSKSQRRVQRRNESLVRRIAKARANGENFNLFRRYINARHSIGAMAEMGSEDFKEMVEATPGTTCVVEYHDRSDAQPGAGKLVAVALTDVVYDSLSMVYSFFDPSLSRCSLGTFMILDHIHIAKQAGFSYLYLGYWVPNSDKMAYKSSFGASEVYSLEHWTDLTGPLAQSLSEGRELRAWQTASGRRH